MKEATYMRRCRHQIIRLMLEVAKDGIKKTPLMYASFLSWTQLKPYLKLLIDMGLLSEEAPYYYTSDKGQRWVEAYDALRQFEDVQRT